VGFASIEVRIVALAETATLLAIDYTATSGVVGVLGNVGAKASSVQPDTARIVNLLIVPIASNSVTTDERINILIDNVDMIDAVISNLEQIVVLRFVVGVGIVVSIVFVIDVPVIVRKLVTITEARASKLTGVKRSASVLLLSIFLSLLTTRVNTVRTTAKQAELLTAVPGIKIAIDPTRSTLERAKAGLITEGGRALNDSRSLSANLWENVGMGRWQQSEDLAIETSFNIGGASSLCPINDVEDAIVIRLNTNRTLVHTLQIDETVRTHARIKDGGDGRRALRSNGKIVAKGNFATSSPVTIPIGTNLQILRRGVGGLMATTNGGIVIAVGAALTSLETTSSLTANGNLSTQA